MTFNFVLQNNIFSILEYNITILAKSWHSEGKLENAIANLSPKKLFEAHNKKSDHSEILFRTISKLPTYTY